MGIIRYILLLVFFISILNVNAKIVRDTVEFDGVLYVEHFVKAGESLNKISKLHNVKVSEIIKANELNSRLTYNQLLYIPVNLNNTSSLEHKKHYNSNEEELNLALLMPYYLIKNDTMFNDFEDTDNIESIYYNLSEAALSFHIGVTLALDSLRNQGKEIVLHTFDTNKDSLKVKNLVTSGLLDDMDIIIGPLHARNFNILCRKYGKSKDKILINPLSRLTNSVRKFSAVFQISPTVESQQLIISKKVLNRYKKKKVMVLYQKRDSEIAEYINKIYKKDNRKINLFEIEHTHVDSLRNIFSDFQVVIIPSSNQAFVSKLLASIGIMDSVSIVFGLDAWKRYDNLDIGNLMELDVHLPISNSFNYNNKHDKAFLDLFEQRYNTNQGKYTYVGYNIIMHFFSDFRKFQFRRLSKGGRINMKAPLYHYKDYELIPLN